MFSRKGARDATPAVVTTYDNEPRTSQATYTAA
jgi:hypothetical protein